MFIKFRGLLRKLSFVMHIIKKRMSRRRRSNLIFGGICLFTVTIKNLQKDFSILTVNDKRKNIRLFVTDLK